MIDLSFLLDIWKTTSNLVINLTSATVIFIAGAIAGWAAKIILYVFNNFVLKGIIQNMINNFREKPKSAISFQKNAGKEKLSYSKKDIKNRVLNFIQPSLKLKKQKMKYGELPPTRIKPDNYLEFIKLTITNNKKTDLHIEKFKMEFRPRFFKQKEYFVFPFSGTESENMTIKANTLKSFSFWDFDIIKNIPTDKIFWRTKVKLFYLVKKGENLKPKYFYSFYIYKGAYNLIQDQEFKSGFRIENKGEPISLNPEKVYSNFNFRKALNETVDYIRNHQNEKYKKSIEQLYPEALRIVLVTLLYKELVNHKFIKALNFDLSEDKYILLEAFKNPVRWKIIRRADKPRLEHYADLTTIPSMVKDNNGSTSTSTFDYDIIEIFRDFLDEKI